MHNKILNAALTAIIAIGVASATTEAVADQSKNSKAQDKLMKGMEKCYGIVKAGLNDCGTSKNNNCAGTSTYDGDKSAWIYLPKGTCGKIIGGRSAPK